MDTYHYLYPDTPLFVPLFFAAVLLRWLYASLNKPFRKMWKSIKHSYFRFYWWLHDYTHSVKHSSRRGYYNPLYKTGTRTQLAAIASKPAAPGKFKPWRADYPVIAGWFVTGLVWLLAAALVYSLFLAHPAVIAIAMLGVVPLYIGAVRLDNVFERKHNIAVEQLAATQLVAMLPPGWVAKRNYMLRRGGDVDLSIISLGGDSCVIDVKSWHSWSGYKRTLKAIRAIKRQKNAMRATYAAIWLPHAEQKTVLKLDDYVVICGDARFAIKYLRRQLRHLVAIQFPAAPAEDICKFVSGMGFRWMPDEVRWRGALSDQQIAALKPKIQDFGGMLDKIEKAS